MDPVTERALDDLKSLLREKVISLAEWRAEVAALIAAAQRVAPTPALPAPPVVANTEFDDINALIARERALNAPRRRVIMPMPKRVQSARLSLMISMRLSLESAPLTPHAPRGRKRQHPLAQRSCGGLSAPTTTSSSSAFVIACWGSPKTIPAPRTPAQWLSSSSR